MHMHLHKYRPMGLLYTQKYVYIYVLLLSPAQCAPELFLGHTRNRCWPFWPCSANADALVSEVLDLVSKLVLNKVWFGPEMEQAFKGYLGVDYQTQGYTTRITKPPNYSYD